MLLRTLWLRDTIELCLLAAQRLSPQPWTSTTRLLDGDKEDRWGCPRTVATSGLRPLRASLWAHRIELHIVVDTTPSPTIGEEAGCSAALRWARGEEMLGGASAS